MIKKSKDSVVYLQNTNYSLQDVYIQGGREGERERETAWDTRDI